MLIKIEDIESQVKIINTDYIVSISTLKPAGKKYTHILLANGAGFCATYESVDSLFKRINRERRLNR